jgi:heme oxygenase
MFLNGNPYFYRMSLTIPVLSAAELLKEKTRASHAQAEKLLYPFLNGISSSGDYAAILKMFYGFYEPLEKIHSSFISVTDLNDVSERKHTRHLLRDLKNLNIEPDHIPLCSDLPSIKSKAAAFGSMYVLEGATLGGRMITKMLLQHPVFPLESGSLHFFGGYGDATREKWIQFQQALNAQTETSEMVQAANESFDCLGRWIQKNLIL